MTTTPLEPHPEPDDGIPAADAGAGAPPSTDGFGVDGDDGHGDGADDSD